MREDVLMLAAESASQRTSMSRMRDCRKEGILRTEREDVLMLKAEAVSQRISKFRTRECQEEGILCTDSKFYNQEVLKWQIKN